MGGDKQVDRLGKEVVVTPDWVVDSVKTGKRKDEKEYHPSWLVKGQEEDESIRKIARQNIGEQERISTLKESSAEDDNLCSVQLHCVDEKINTSSLGKKMKKDQLEVRERVNCLHVQEVEDITNVMTENLGDEGPVVEIHTTSSISDIPRPQSDLSLLRLHPATPDHETGSNKNTSYQSAVSRVDQEEDSPSDYFSQDTESAEEEVPTTKRKAEHKDSLESSSDDIFPPTPEKKKKVRKVGNDTSQAD